MGASKDGITILEHDMVTDHGFVNDMIKATHPTMSNGPALDNLNSQAFQIFDETLSQISRLTTVNMLEWIGEQIMQVTTDVIYGPQNHMRNPQT